MFVIIMNTPGLWDGAPAASYRRTVTQAGSGRAAERQERPASERLRLG